MGRGTRRGTPVRPALVPLVERVQKTLRKRGYEPLTPSDSRTPLVAFALKDARKKLDQLMTDAKARITLSRNRFRFSVAVFNDADDVERGLEALPAAPP